MLACIVLFGARSLLTLDRATYFIHYSLVTTHCDNYNKVENNFKALSSLSSFVVSLPGKLLETYEEYNLK